MSGLIIRKNEFLVFIRVCVLSHIVSGYDTD